MKIVIIDGQGGKMGALLIEKIKASSLLSDAELIAIGTNSIATAAMLRAGADAGATGENPVVVNSKGADFIAGPIGILAADSLLGEVTPNMAVAIGQSAAQKILLPVNKCNHHIAGVQNFTMQELVTDAVKQIESLV
ncbi:MAG: DUF3842 family protein [Bacteroidaceae bacterium]|nr:DUF3842 family protein [Bacteroidaceae bacterium]